ncbi:hypothetical protein LN042_27605 [Kitasatospora sp. RB6PN24]|uniref:hypothetical protein n=1 Tax=Kitasatospora humi TaxID=2893891 RepID=UPI001E40A4B8|nr:hypothetical protein [Kitasatospora humi]MCC9310791.1 hypothetical protein [Kitasatospora humi]
MAGLVSDGHGGPDIAQAIATCLPTPLRPTQHLVLTADQELYPPGIATVDIDDPRLES